MKTKKIDKNLIKSQVLNNEDIYVDCLLYLSNIKYASSLADNFCCEIFHTYKFINAIGVKVESKYLSEIVKCDYVKYISSASRVFAQINTSKNIMNIDAFHSRGILGKGKCVAIIDTGIQPMPDFCIPRNRIRKFVDLIAQKDMPYDDNGHGTFVSGVVAGNGLISNGVYSGVAPSCEIVSIKALDSHGEASAFKILEAMQWIYNNYHKYGINVVCMSFGSEPLEKNDPLVMGAEMLWKCGVVVVVASGNSGPNESTIKSPAISNRVITVGGLDDGRNSDGMYKVADFSSRGPAGNFFKPDILAPAKDIISNNNHLVGGKAYTTMSGTSVATPMIAGVCLLLLQTYPYLSPEQVKGYILKCGNRITNNRNKEGFGYFVAR